MRRAIWLVAVLATSAAAQGDVDDAYFKNLVRLEGRTPVPVEEIATALSKATSSQRGRYEYLYLSAVTAYLRNKIEAGDAFRDATLAAMRSDGFDASTCTAIEKRLSAAAKAAKSRVKPKEMQTNNRFVRGSGVSTGYEVGNLSAERIQLHGRPTDAELKNLALELTVDEISKIQQAAKQGLE